jgi:molybdopterin molybdotransferase
VTQLSAEDRNLLPIEEARRRLLEVIPVLPGEMVPIHDARGQVLDEDVASDIDLPPFDNSAMDGYAVRSADTAGASPASPVVLRVVEHLPAGTAPTREVASGEAARIMTGAPLPAGADGVIIVENTDGGAETVAIYKAIGAGDNVRRRGEGARTGEVVLARGTPIRPAEQAMLASLGRLEARVVRRPRVAVLSTGDELVSPDRRPGPGQIRDSNRYGLLGQVAALGAIPVDVGLVADDHARIRDALERALDEGDCVVTSGGVSVGDYDLTKQILAELGEIHFWRVAMKPGKPQAFGLARGKPVFGLPGNPVSSLVAFEQFVRPALRKMAGYTQLCRPRLLAVADAPMRKPAGKVHFLRAIIEEREGTLHARLTGPQGSGILASMTAANGLVILDLDVTEVREGEPVLVELWD